MKAASPCTITKVFKRDKNSVWWVKNAGVVKVVLEENNQLTRIERATKHVRCFTWEFFWGGKENSFHKGCLPFDRKERLGCRKHNHLGKRFIRLPQKCHIRYGLNPKKGRIFVACLLDEKLVNGKQHSAWFVPTGMNGLPQNVLLNFRLEFPKSDLTILIYPPSGISEIFFQMV